MSSVEEDIVHNIDDSDDEPEEKFTRNMDQTSSPTSAKYHPNDTENRYERNCYDDQEDERRYVDPTYMQRRNYIRDVLQKQSASKLYRYMAVKRSITWYVISVYSSILCALFFFFFFWFIVKHLNICV